MDGDGETKKQVLVPIEEAQVAGTLLEVHNKLVRNLQVVPVYKKLMVVVGDEETGQPKLVEVTGKDGVKKKVPLVVERETIVGYAQKEFPSNYDELLTRDIVLGNISDDAFKDIMTMIRGAIEEVSFAKKYGYDFSTTHNKKVGFINAYLAATRSISFVGATTAKTNMSSVETMQRLHQQTMEMPTQEKKGGKWGGIPRIFPKKEIKMI